MLPKTIALDVLQRMLMVRRFEEAVIAVAMAHPEVGRNHLYIGHEAIAAPATVLLRPNDCVHTTHRNHGYIIARGVDPGRALAEIMARADGLAHAKGGTFHLCERAAGFGPTSALVGGSMGLAVGAAFAMKKHHPGTVSVANFGDGTLDEGISYEALNVASLLQLPVLFICENNSLKRGHESTSMLVAEHLTDVPKTLRIECRVVDGNDAAAVYATLEAALERIRSTGAPLFVEATVARWPGCYQVQPEFTTGVTDVSMAWGGAEVTGPHAGWIRTADPILRFVRTILDAGLVSQAEIVELDRTAGNRIAAARAFAEASPFPKPEEALDSVFA